MKSSAPERSCTAPAGTDVVDHAELVLYHIRIRPYLLVRITRKFTAGLERLVILSEEVRRVTHIIISGCPAWSVAISTADLLEEFTTFQYVRIVMVAGCRNGKSSVPYHEICIVLIGHFHR